MNSALKGNQKRGLYNYKASKKKQKISSSFFYDLTKASWGWR